MWGPDVKILITGTEGYLVCLTAQELLREYEKEGITIDYLALFNEPGGYTEIPFEDIRDLLADHVGPHQGGRGRGGVRARERAAKTREHQPVRELRRV